MPCTQLSEGAPCAASEHGTSPSPDVASAAVSRPHRRKSRTESCYTLACGPLQPLHHLRGEIARLNGDRTFQAMVRTPLSGLKKRFLRHHMTDVLVTEKIAIVLVRFYMIAIFAGASRGACIFFNVITAASGRSPSQVMRQAFSSSCGRPHPISPMTAAQRSSPAACQRRIRTA